MWERAVVGRRVQPLTRSLHSHYHKISLIYLGSHSSSRHIITVHIHQQSRQQSHNSNSQHEIRGCAGSRVRFISAVGILLLITLASVQICLRAAHLSRGRKLNWRGHEDSGGLQGDCDFMVWWRRYEVCVCVFVCVRGKETMWFGFRGTLVLQGENGYKYGSVAQG